MQFECEHCHTVYVSERFFKKHKCKVLAKNLEAKSSIGNSAFGYYKEYLKSKKCYNTDFDTFLNSKYYRSFINFANFVKKKKVPDVSIYLEFVNARRIQPPTWSSDIVYSAYIKYLDTIEPLRLIKISISTLNSLSKTFNCEIEEVLPDKLYINDIINLLNMRYLSPWFLLNSIHIRSILSDPNITESQHKSLERFINPHKWQKNFQQNKSIVTKIKKHLTLSKL